MIRVIKGPWAPVRSVKESQVRLEGVVVVALVRHMIQARKNNQRQHNVLCRVAAPGPGKVVSHSSSVPSTNRYLPTNDTD